MWHSTSSVQLFQKVILSNTPLQPQHLEFGRGLPSWTRTCPLSSWLHFTFSKRVPLSRSLSAEPSYCTSWPFGACMRLRGSYFYLRARLISRVRPIDSPDLKINWIVAFWRKTRPPRLVSWPRFRRLGYRVSLVLTFRMCSGMPTKLQPASWSTALSSYRVTSSIHSKWPYSLPQPIHLFRGARPSLLSILCCDLRKRTEVHG